MSQTLHVMHCHGCGWHSDPMERRELDKAAEAHAFAPDAGPCTPGDVIAL